MLQSCIWKSLHRWLKSIGLWIGTVSLIWSCQTVAPAPVTVKLSGWGSSPTEQRLLQQVLQQFEATHPAIEVKYEVIADQYMDVIKTRLIGDAAPDVFYLEAVEAPFLLDQAVLEPLDAYLQPEFDLADFEPNLLRLFQHDSHLYGLPKDYSTLALFYNQQALANAGIAEPPRTWAELVDTAARLTIDRDGNGKIDQFGLGIAPELARLGYLIRAYEGQIVDAAGNAAYGSSQAMQGLAAIVELYNRSIAAQPADVGSSSGTEMFGQGKAAMVIEGNWAIPFLQETFPALKFATAEVPVLNQRPGTMAYTVAYVMNRRSRHKAAAWELIAYLTGAQGMKDWTSSGIALPTRRSIAQQQQLNQDPLRSALVAGVDYATPWQIGTYPSAIMHPFDNYFLSALLGQQPLSQALQQAQTEANQQVTSARS